MMSQVRIRPTGVTAHLDRNGHGDVVAKSGGSVKLAGSPSMEGLNPLELLDASLAGCIALSLRIAARNLGFAERLGAVSVEVTGAKAAEPPSRIARQTCRYAIEGDFTDAERAAMVAEAHTVCTIGNSYATSIDIIDGEPLA